MPLCFGTHKKCRVFKYVHINFFIYHVFDNNICIKVITHKTTLMHICRIHYIKWINLDNTVSLNSYNPYLCLH